MLSTRRGGGGGGEGGGVVKGAGPDVTGFKCEAFVHHDH